MPVISRSVPQDLLGRKTRGATSLRRKAVVAGDVRIKGSPVAPWCGFIVPVQLLRRRMCA
jgi:hypothetical protein